MSPEIATDWAAPHVGLRRASDHSGRDRGEKPFHVWRTPEGELWAAFFRTSDGFAIRFPDLATFVISRDGVHVVCLTSPGVAESTLDHLRVNQVQPLALSLQGRLVFHASGVETGSSAIAFVAESGRGKSTLAAGFVAREQRLLTDDALVLKSDGGTYRALPGHPSLRLWEDSHAEALNGAGSLAPAVEYTSKARILCGPALPYCQADRPLRAAYFLGPKRGASEDVVFTRLAPPAALIEWAKHSFLLDIEDRRLIGGHFDKIAKLANAVPCFRLDYPRRYEAMDRVCAAIIAHQAELPNVSAREGGHLG